MSEWWQARPWRLIQTNMREIDMRDIDARVFVEQLLAFRANAVLVNTAGIIASYPTALPFHFQSPYLTGDSLERIIAACHAADIKVLARTDFSKVRRPIYEMHPEWAYVSPAGHVVDYNGDIHVCINGDYQQHYALEIMREAVSTLDLDGIFFNMGGYQVSDYSRNYYGPCQCESCRKAFMARYGLTLPTVEDMDDPVFRKYTLFKRETLMEHHAKVYRFLKDLRPDLCIANHEEFHNGFRRQESNTAIDRPLPHWQYSASDNTKWVVSSYPEVVSSNTTVDFIDFPYRHVAVSPHQQKLRLAQDLANGGSIDYYLIGRLDNHEDRSGYDAVKEMFAYHAAHEDVYQGLVSVAEIALMNGPDANQHEFRGWFRLLTESHQLFDTMMAQEALDMDWGKYKAIILPDYQVIPDILVTKLDGYVRHGGTLIVVGRSGLRDGELEARDGFPLECLGMERLLTIREDMTSSYLRLPKSMQIGGLAETELVYLDGPYLYGEYAATAQQLMSLIPPHNFGPPERCYYEIVTDHPGVVVNAYGQGKAMFIPWLPGSLYYRQGHTNTLDWVQVILQQLAGLKPLGGTLSPMIETTVFENAQEGYQLVHLVNGSGHFGTSFFAPIVATDLSIEVPCGRPPKGVTRVATGKPVPHEHADGSLTIAVDKLDMLAAFKIDL